MGKLIQEKQNPWEVWEHLCVGADPPAQSQSQNLTFGGFNLGHNDLRIDVIIVIISKVAR